jgi:hypothetical protein
MKHCEHFKQLLMDDGSAAIERARQDDTALAGHLRDCLECQALLEAWKQIPDLLEQLPEHEPDQEAEQKIREAAASGRPPTSAIGRRLLAPSLASAAVLLAAIGLSRELLMHESPTFQTVPGKQQPVGEIQTNPVAAPAPALREGLDGFLDYRSDDGSVAADIQPGPENQETDRLELSGSRARGAGFKVESASEFEAKPESPVEEKRLNRVRQKADLEDRDAEFNLAVNEPADREYEEVEQFRKAKLSKKEAPETEAPLSSTLEVAAIGGVFANGAFDFLGHYQQTENLTFQSPTGYWANSYVPGDPEIRLLSARLAQWDRSWLDGNAFLEQAVAPVQQPFDAPADNALALSVMADANAVSASGDGINRMRLQVGIRGIEHRRGQRPAMNVGVVVDLPPDAPVEVRIATRALLDAMLQSRQHGDRFSLVMTDSGLVVEAGDFRFGSLQLAKQQILGENTARQDSGAGMQEMTLQAAMLRAGALVQQTDDPSRPLGSSSVLLITAGSLANVEQLAMLAHEKAIEGITLSVFPLGNQPPGESVEKLVLAGLGNRRFLEAPGKARQLIEEELHASSRAVARAARLSIRLAPGVRLIDVVGSERLDARRSQRVRDIENSMDRRLSANLGIQADRGEDEDGIQIVIPSIFSGDSVTVLLDVATSRPGAIADVSLRYKDLVFLRNGNLQSQLTLGGGEIIRGPAELAVLKNLLSYHFAASVEQAAEALGRQQPAEAIAALKRMRTTIEQARRDVPAWTNDPDLVRDSQVLDRYIAALTSPGAGAHQSFLADSLRYAAWAKTHRPLPEHVIRSVPNERSH